MKDQSMRVQYNVIHFRDRRFTGPWKRYTFAQAIAGEIRTAVDAFASELGQCETFLTISVHDAQDGFRFFIGKCDPDGTIILPEGNYQSAVPCDEPWQTYVGIQRLDLTPRELFGGRRDADSLPVKVEIFQKTCGYCMTEIQIPLC